MFPASQHDANDSLIRLLNQIAQVTTPAEWLEAVSFYARDRGASAAYLTWIDSDEAGHPNKAEMVAEWVADAVIPQMPLGMRVPIPDDWRHKGGWFDVTDAPTFIDDVRTTSLLTESSRSNYALIQTQALVFLPQHVGGRWVSAVAFHWRTPQPFTEADHAFYTAVMRHAGPIISALRLMQQTLAAQAEMMAAKADSDLLYKLAQSVNAAMTYQEVVEAVAPLQPKGNGVSLILWEGFDHASATYFDLIAGAGLPPFAQAVVGTRFPKEALPIARVMYGNTSVQVYVTLYSG